MDRFDIEAMLLELRDQLKQFPTDVILREFGIPEAAIMKIEAIDVALEEAIEQLNPGE